MPLSSLSLSSASDEEARRLFFEQFDFEKSVSVVSALRLVLEKVCLEGETQEQDRILAALARRYNETCSDDLLTSLLDGNATHKDRKHQRMRRVDFVQNTLGAMIEEQSKLNDNDTKQISTLLESVYDDIEMKPLLNIRAERQRVQPRNLSSRRSWALGLRRSSKEFSFHHSFLRPEPFLMRKMDVKHVLDKSGGKAPNRQWATFYVVICGSTLLLCSSEPALSNNGSMLTLDDFSITRMIPLRHALATPIPGNGYNDERKSCFQLFLAPFTFPSFCNDVWEKNAKSIPFLKSSRFSSFSKKSLRQTFFDLSHRNATACGGLYVLDARTPAACREWTDAINFWAAMESHTPASSCASGGIGGGKPKEYGLNKDAFSQTNFPRDVSIYSTPNLILLPKSLPKPVLLTLPAVDTDSSQFQPDKDMLIELLLRAPPVLQDKEGNESVYNYCPPIFAEHDVDEAVDRWKNYLLYLKGEMLSLIEVMDVGKWHVGNGGGVQELVVFYESLAKWYLRTMLLPGLRSPALSAESAGSELATSIASSRSVSSSIPSLSVKKQLSSMMANSSQSQPFLLIDKPKRARTWTQLSALSIISEQQKEGASIRNWLWQYAWTLVGLFSTNSHDSFWVENNIHIHIFETTLSSPESPIFNAATITVPSHDDHDDKIKHTDDANSTSPEKSPLSESETSTNTILGSSPTTFNHSITLPPPSNMILDLSSATSNDPTPMFPISPTNDVDQREVPLEKDYVKVVYNWIRKWEWCQWELARCRHYLDVLLSKQKTKINH